MANDGSTDGTGVALRELAARFANFRFVDLERNQGYGAAMKRAIDMSRGELVVTIDSDGQFDIGDAALLRKRLAEGYDCVTGYRERKRDTLPRVVAHWGYNNLVKMLCGINFTDSQCALKIYHGDLLRSLPLEARGFTFPTETLIRMHNQGCRLAEEPVKHRFRKVGRSKLKFFRTARVMFTFLVYLRVKLALHDAGILSRV